MSTIAEQIALEEAEILSVNTAIIDLNNRVLSIEGAILSSEESIIQYNTQIDQYNAQIVEFNASNMLRNDIISNLELLQQQAKISNKQKKGKK